MHVSKQYVVLYNIKVKSMYSQTGHRNCSAHDRGVNKRSKCRGLGTITTKNRELSSARWTKEGVQV